MIFKIMGHAPLSIVRRSSKEKSPKAIAVAAALTTTNFAHSGAGSVYNVILIVLLVGLNFVSVPLLYEGEYLSKTPFTETIEVTQAVGGNAVVVFIWLLNLLRQKTMVKIINRLMNVDATVFRLTETNRNYFVLLFLTNFSVWILLIVSNQQSYHTAVLGFMNEIVPGVIINWFMIQYVVTVKLIEKRFSALNRALLDSPTSSIVVPIRSLILGCVSADDIDFPNVLSFRRAHSDLYEISCQVAEFYSLPIVFAIAFGCFSIIYNAYWVVVPFVFVSEDEPTFMIVNAISWLGAWMLPITTLALAINAVTAQVFMNIHDHEYITVLRKNLTSFF